MTKPTPEATPSIWVPLYELIICSKPVCDLRFLSFTREFTSGHVRPMKRVLGLSLFAKIRKISESTGTDSSRCQRFKFVPGLWTTQRLLFPKTLPEE